MRSELMVRREVVLEAPPEEVWSALTEPDRLAEWFANEVELDLEPGGEGRFGWGNGEERRAVVDSVQPCERLSFRWFSDEDAETIVEFVLQVVPDGTRLQVSESAAATTPQASAAGVATDWSWAVGLGALARCLAPVLV